MLSTLEKEQTLLEDPSHAGLRKKNASVSDPRHGDLSLTSGRYPCQWTMMEGQWQTEQLGCPCVRTPSNTCQCHIGSP